MMLCGVYVICGTWMRLHMDSTSDFWVENKRAAATSKEILRKTLNIVSDGVSI